MKTITSISLIILAALAGCSSLETHFRTSGLSARPKKIIIKSFESRSMKYNPYVVKNLRDSLRFEFFKRGYEVALSENGAGSRPAAIVREAAGNKTPEAAGDAKQETAAPVIEERLVPPERRDPCVSVSGALFEAEIGEIADTQTSTMISFVVRDGEGAQIGEGRFLSSRSMTDAKAVREVARRITVKIHSSFAGK